MVCKKLERGSALDVSASLGNLSGTSKVPDEQFDPFANGNFPEKEFCLKQAEPQASWPLCGHFKLNILKETNVGKDFKLSAQGNASVRQLWLSVKSTLFNAALTVESG